MDSSKPRFNENYDDETRSIRQEATSQNQRLGKINLANNRNRNGMDGVSNISGSLRSAVHSISQSH